MTFRLGLTGSIGMGKSTTADLFREEGCDVWDADYAVHLMYKKGGKAVQPIKDKFPTAIVGGEVSRTELKKMLGNNPSNFNILEAIVHPLAAQSRTEFVENATSEICIFDIPILFETGGDKNMDAVACVTIDYETQKQRVLERGTMTLAQLEQILEKQISIEEKMRRSDFIIKTDTLEHARSQVAAILNEIKGQKKNA
jgi:dephospho-CoA kinase